MQPVVLLIEDAQYADSGLLDFLDHLIDWSRDLPVYVLVFARPELGQARPGFGSGRNRITLTLDPLDPVSMDELVDALVPGMPPAARAAISGQAQGVPLFAVETVRSLIDRDIVQPVEGVYRLIGDIGELAVPDSLHALLAARLDALDPDVRRLVADAAVLGTTFPAEALIAVSGQDEDVVRAALADLVRREVLSVSADPLSPERGSYQFAQQMLRQVAYDTLSRRDRKTRHLAVAAHLRAAFAGDGEEMADVIARHYLDALHAVPDDPDTAQIRGQAIAALIRAAERAERTGAPARRQLCRRRRTDPHRNRGRTAAYRRTRRPMPGCCGNAPRRPPPPLQTMPRPSTMLAAPTIITCSAARPGRPLAPRPSPGACYVSGAVTRKPASGSPPRWRCCARNPTPTPSVPWTNWRHWRCFAGSPDANRLTVEALILGQALDVGTGQLADLFVTRAIYLCMAERRPEGVAYFREGARLATQADDNMMVGRALLNLSDALANTDPAAAAEAARTAAGHLRRAGIRDYLAVAIHNLVQVLLMLGEWDAAEAELTQADGLWRAGRRRVPRSRPGLAGGPAG